MSTNSLRTPSFTHAEYCNLTNELKRAGYKFTSFEKAAGLLAQQQPFVLMRHDIDFDLDKALELALLESELGIYSTYFFLMRTEHYNIFSRDGSEKIRRILGCGHQLGLHFDCSAYSSSFSVAELNSACRNESQILANWFDLPVSVVSYHRPSQLILAGDPALASPLLHTYTELFNKRIFYISDSQGRWRFGYPLESAAFRERRPLHILIHPVWWAAQAEEPLARLRETLNSRTHDLRRSYADNCKVFTEKP